MHGRIDIGLRKGAEDDWIRAAFAEEDHTVDLAKGLDDLDWTDDKEIAGAIHAPLVHLKTSNR